MAAQANPFEAAARLAKTQKLGNALIGAGITPSEARRMDAGQWKLAAKFAGTSEPSQLTVEAVIAYVAAVEAAKVREAGLDPFRGF